jgi:ATP-dependent Clp protease adapter protein ClpS
LRKTNLFAVDYRAAFQYFVQENQPKRAAFHLMTTQPLEQVGEDDEVLTEEPTKVILFNDEAHTFDEVITQLIKALKCTSQHAEELTWDVHNQGKAVVFTGELVKCMQVSSVLEEIKLMTQIEV